MTSKEKPTTDQPAPEGASHPAVQNVAEAHKLLESLREQVGKHPALEEAIMKLELALSALTIQTGGLI
jgi:hypothetical protein